MSELDSPPQFQIGDIVSFPSGDTYHESFDRHLRHRFGNNYPTLKGTYLGKQPYMGSLRYFDVVEVVLGEDAKHIHVADTYRMKVEQYAIETLETEYSIE